MLKKYWPDPRSVCTYTRRLLFTKNLLNHQISKHKYGVVKNKSLKLPMDPYVCLPVCWSSLSVIIYSFTSHAPIGALVKYIMIV